MDHDKIMTKILSRVLVVNRCHEYQGTRNSAGYGIIQVDGKQRRAHRVVYEAHHGEIPDGTLVCHSCDNPSCVNIQHLFLATHEDNAKDRNAKGRQAKATRHGRWVDGNKARLEESKRLHSLAIVEKIRARRASKS